VRVFDAVSGGDALLVLDMGCEVDALVAFKDLATGALRLACASGDVLVFDPVAGGEALVVLEGHTKEVNALTAFTDPATGEPRLVSGARLDFTVRVWNPAAGDAAIETEPEGHSDSVRALVTFKDPATGALRVATGSNDETIRVWDAETGGALLVIHVGLRVCALMVFVDPATGAQRIACGTGNWRMTIGDVRVIDPVAGGEALLVIEVGSAVYALAFFADPATGAPRLACTAGEKVRVIDPVAGGEALLVLDARSKVYALVFFADPATGAPRLACGTSMNYGRSGDVRIFDAVAGGDALVVLEGHTSTVKALTVFEDQATGDLRLASGSDDNSVRIWDLVAGGAALFVLEGHTAPVRALTAFADPATGETRLASGSGKTLHVWDLSKSSAALQVVAFDDNVSALAVRSNMSGLFVASGKGWGELRVA
jgi:WD40 repeat protein